MSLSSKVQKRTTQQSNVIKIPDAGDSFDFENLNIAVTETDAHRVEKVKVIINEKTEEEEEK